tara:strand:- start:1550 stop:2119 length:570 start_codon:yes stop_codon:yes gene_type:complete
MSLGYNSHRPIPNIRNNVNNLNAPVPSAKNRKNTNTNQSGSSTSSISATIPNTNSFSKSMNIQDNAITQRRLEYVETQLKKTQVEFKEHVTQLQDLKTDSKADLNSLGFIQEVVGTAEKDIISIESGKKLFEKGDNIHLVYPMKKDGNKTIMRAVIVDPVTAQFSYSWVCVFDMQSGKPIRPITQFRLP